MPEINQYNFTHKELLESLIKKAGVHEGKWQLIANFAFGAANVGPTPEQLIPGAFVGVTHLGIVKATPESPEALTLDAAVVNPASSSTSRRRPSGRSVAAEKA